MNFHDTLDARGIMHKRLVKAFHWIMTLSFLILAFSGYEVIIFLNFS